MGRQTKADRVISRLTSSQMEILERFCKERANATDIHRWLIQFDSTLSYDSVLTWYSRDLSKRGKGEEFSESDLKRIARLNRENDRLTQENNRLTQEIKRLTKEIEMLECLNDRAMQRQGDATADPVSRVFASLAEEFR